MSEQAFELAVTGATGAWADRRAILDALALVAGALAWLSDTAVADTGLLPPTGRVPSIGSAGHARLSPREREVAALMGRGDTNRQIAEALSISIATVERHASNIFTKLGVHSRSQVAVWAALGGLT